jgi:aminocarboxymuconate-semialdehyde decarboxylase
LFAETIQFRPERFGAFASLPMPHIDDSLIEVAFALEQLRLDGVMLSTSYDGRYIGSSEFDVLLAELDRRGALVFVHPVTPMGLGLLGLDFPASLLEYAFDTPRCIANLLRYRVPHRFPNVRFVFSHAGGTMPYLLSRMSLLEHFVTPGHTLEVENDRDAIQFALRRFYYDTALSASDAVLALLQQVVGIDRLVFGSDYPQVPENYAKSTANAVLQSKALQEQQRRLVAHTNGLALLPRLAKAQLPKMVV